MSRAGLIVVLSVAWLCAQPASEQAIWEDFAKWSAELKALPPGERKPMMAVYVDRLVARGVEKEEAQRRANQVNTLRRASLEREAIYWNASFKLGGGPEDPLRLLQEAIRKVKPGRALDAGMGRGRNAIYLASLGWDVTGYDMATDALQVAQAYAAKAGVKLKTVQAKHDQFDFGENQWDLIVCSYNYMSASDPQWARVFWRALRPGGLVVFQTAAPGGPIASSGSDIPAALEVWKQFRLIRYENLDAGVVDDDWQPSRTNPTVRLIVRKPAL